MPDPNYKVLAPYVSQINPKGLELFDWYLNQPRANKHPFAGKKILLNGHVDRITWKVVQTLVALGAEVDLAQVGTQALPIAADVLQSGNIEFYRGLEAIPQHKRNDYYDICFDCNGALLSTVTPKAGMVELTHSDKSYEDYAFPVISVDKGDVKVVETRFGTGPAFVESLEEYYLAAADEDVRRQMELDRKIGVLASAILKYCTDHLAKNVMEENDDTELTVVTSAKILKQLIENRDYQSLTSLLENKVLRFGGITETTQLQELSNLLSQRYGIDYSSDTASNASSEDMHSSSPPSSSSYLRRRNSLDLKDKSTVLEEIKKKKYVIFGGGKVGTGIAMDLLKKGVPKDNITVIESSKNVINRAKFDRNKTYNFIHYNYETGEGSRENLLAALSSANIVVTATGVSDLLEKMKITPAHLSPDCELGNMGHQREDSPSFENYPRKLGGTTDLPFNFNKGRLGKEGGGYPTDPFFLITTFIGLCSAAEILTQPDKVKEYGLTRGALHRFPVAEDSKIVMEYYSRYHLELSDDYWHCISKEGLAAYLKTKAEAAARLCRSNSPTLPQWGQQITPTKLELDVSVKRSASTTALNMLS
jgi:hypothetical protein